MKHLMGIITVLTICTGSALAASPDYEACARQEKALKTRKIEDCGGLSYLFNPSACYAAQKALRSFESGPCGHITPPARAATPTQAAAPPQAPAAVVPPSRTVPTAQPAATTAAETETLQAENIRLKAENAKLREEILLLKRRSTPDTKR